MKMITSADGTPIAVEQAGSGPAVVLLGGAFNDRSTVAGLAEALSGDFTAYWYDRRGRGDSGDTPPYAVEREVEDLAAVVTHAGGTAHVVGHSSGAILALEAAASGVPIDRLAAYEPAWVAGVARPRPGADLVDRITELVAAGSRSDAAALFLTEAVGVPAPVVEMMKGSPDWAGMQRLAHTLPYDVAVCGRGQAVPVERLATVRVPTLVVDGDASSADMRAAAAAAAAAVPGARYETLPGQDHAVLQHPEALAPLLRSFLAGTVSRG